MLMKIIARFALLFALVLSPLSVAHAESSIHRGHDVIASQPHMQSYKHSHGSARVVLVEDERGSASADVEEASGKCCSSICHSVVLEETGAIDAKKATVGKYLVLDTQRSSIEISGFLRPPQFLI